LFVVGWFVAATDFAKAVKNTTITGAPLFTLFGKPVYNPFYFILSIFRYGREARFVPYYYHSLFHILWFSIFAVGFAIAWTVITNILFRDQKNLHGTAREATKRDLLNHGLLKTEGIVCGEGKNAWVIADRKKDSALHLKLIKSSFLICHTGMVNTIALMGTGSGKGVSNILTTLNSYRGSVIVYDPKGENFSRSAGWRNTFSRVLKFAPVEFDTIRFNFLMLIRDGDDCAVRDADLLVSLFFTAKKVSEDSASEYFNSNAKILLVGTVLHARFTEDFKDRSLAGVAEYLIDTDISESSLNASAGQEGNADLGKKQCLEMLRTKHFYTVTERMYTKRKAWYDARHIHIGDKIPAPEIDKKVKEAAAQALNFNVKEKATVYSTINTKLRLFADPLIKNATSGNDFEIEDFVESDIPISLYLIVPYSDIERIMFIFQIMINFMMKKFSEGTTEFGAVRLKNDVLCLFDEFPTLGYFPSIAQNMGVLRGYGVHFFIIVQSLSQLVDIYGQNHPFLNHCDIQIIGAPGDIKDAEHFSRTFGNETVHQGKISRSGRMSLTQNQNINFSDNDFGRALLDPADIMRLPDNRVIIYAKGMQPYIAKKCVYYMDSRFKERANMKAPTMDDIIREVRSLPSVERRIAIRKREREAERMRMQTMTARNNDAAIEKDRALFTDEEDDALIEAFARESGGAEVYEVFSEAPVGVRTADELAEGK